MRVNHLVALGLAASAVSVAASPIAITCNGSGLDPGTGRAAVAGVMTFAFEFDPQAQTMIVTEGAPKPFPLQSVKISDGLVTGTDGKWI